MADWFSLNGRVKQRTGSDLCVMCVLLEREMDRWVAAASAVPWTLYRTVVDQMELSLKAF